MSAILGVIAFVLLFRAGIQGLSAPKLAVEPGARNDCRHRDIEAQTRQVCENLKAAVEEAGGTMDDICRVDVYVRNVQHFEQIHKVRREYFRPPAPASTLVEVCKMTSPDYLIEINAIAVVAE
jgi:enamine deaminase RidA (YjgF/YER057c/UK114 family)